MATIVGTINGATLMRSNISGVGARKTWLVSANFGAATSADTCQLQGVGAYLKAHSRNGRTYTLRAAQAAGAGLDTNSQAVFAGGTCTVASDNVSFTAADTTGSPLASATACTGVELMISCDET